MSSQTTSNQEQRKFTVVQNVNIAFCTCLVFGVILYFAGGRSLFEALENHTSPPQDEETDTEPESEAEGDTSQMEISDVMVYSDASQILRQELNEANTELNDLRNQVAMLLNEREQRMSAQEQLAQGAVTLDPDMAMNRARIREAHGIGLSITRELAAYEEAIERCNKIKDALAHTDVGRRVAVVSDLVEKYSNLTHTDAPTDAELVVFEEPFTAVFPRIKSAYEADDCSVIVRPDELEFLQGFLARTRAARSSLSIYEDSLNYLIRSSVSNDPGQQTLAEAVDELREDRALRLMAARVSAEREIEKEASPRNPEEISEDHHHQGKQTFGRGHEMWMDWVPGRPPGLAERQSGFSSYSSQVRAANSLKPYAPVRGRSRRP